MIDKLVTGPLWRLIQEAPNVLSLNSKLHQLKIQLESLALDASPVLSGESLFCEAELSINRDDVYECLIAPPKIRYWVYTPRWHWSYVFGGMLLISEGQAKEQVPGFDEPEQQKVASFQYNFRERFCSVGYANA